MYCGTPAITPTVDKDLFTLDLNSKYDKGVSQKAVLTGDKGEPIKGIIGAGACIKLWGPTHRVRNHFSGELRVNMLCVSRTFLKD